MTRTHTRTLAAAASALTLAAASLTTSASDAQAAAPMVATSYGAHYEPSVCAVAYPTWRGHRRFYLNKVLDNGCFTSAWFAGTHPVMLSYGPTIAPWYDSHVHHGIDIDMFPGTAVRAGVAGVVHTHPSTMGPAYGTRGVLVRSGGYDYVLGHLEKLAVHDGQQVSVGQLIGWSGMSGAETEDGPHLHLEVRPAGTSYRHAVDPRTHVLLSPR